MKFLENANLEALASALSVDSGDCRLEARVESYSCKMVQSDKKLFKEMMLAAGTSPNDPQPLSPPTCDAPWLFPSWLRLLYCPPFFLNKSREPSSMTPTQDVVIQQVSSTPNNNNNSSHQHQQQQQQHQYLTVLVDRSRHRSSNSNSDQEPEVTQINGVLCDSISRKTLFDLTTLLNSSFPDYDFSDAKGENFHRVPSLQEAVTEIDSQLSAVVHGYSSTLRSGVWSIIDDEIKLKECNIYSYNPDYNSDPFAEEGCIWSFNYIFSNKRLKRMLFFACRAQSIRDSTDSSFDDYLWNMDAE